MTLVALFQRRAERTPDDSAYRQYDFKKREWCTYTWAGVLKLAGRWQQSLSQERLSPGDRVAVCLRNSIEWVCFDQAALSLGLVVVPLYVQDTPGDIAYVLADSGSKLLLVGSGEQWQVLYPHHGAFPKLERVLCVTRGEPPRSGEAISFSFVGDWLNQDDGEFEDRRHTPDSLATIVYTSGTAGRPKGVMLSHRNILSDAAAILEAIHGYRDDVYLSFLPLSHTFERTVGYYLPIMAGSCVVFARSVKDLPEDLLTVRPTMLIAVPRVFERIHGAVWEQAQEKGKLAGLLLRATVTIGWKRFEAMQGRSTPPGVLGKLAWVFLRHLVASKIISRLGGRVRLAVSGGAPLHGEVSHFFIALGLPVLQGYGLTEASPVVTGNRLEDNVPESVGTPLPGIQISIGNNSELLVRGPNIMLGYWNMPDDTRNTLDRAGWLHTGDQAEIVDARVYIRGRLKDVLVTSTGEKVSPTDIELAICQESLFDMAMIIGEGKPYLAVIMVLNPAAWRRFATSLALDPDGPESLRSQRALDLVLARIASRLSEFPIQARVRAAYLTLEPWTIENGLLTPTLKLKRAEIEKRFAEPLRQLYSHELPA
jgi:long-chain acyl-CoA synthetase